MDTSQTNLKTGGPFRRSWQISTLILIATAWGCASSRQGPLVTRRVQDPPQLSPFARPLMQPGGAPTPYSASRPAPAELGTPSNQYGPLTKIPPRERNRVPELLPTPQQDQSLGGPSLGESAEDELAAPQPDTQTESGKTLPADRERLIVSVDAPETARPGEDIPYQVTIRNADNRKIEEVTVLCSLPEGIMFPGASQRAFQQELGTLSAGEDRNLDLVLRCEKSGRHCVEFRVSAAGIDDVTRSACVTCREMSVELELIGPKNRAAGSRAEYVITMTNHTGRELSGVHVTLQHDGVLEPREASTGVFKKPGKLEWDLGLVRVDERIQIQVEFACEVPSEQTFLTARLRGRGIEPRDVSSMLTVIPRRKIEIDVADEDDPVAIGERVVYDIRVTNYGLRPVSDLVLELAPNGLQPLGVSVDGRDALASAVFDAQSGILRLPLSGPIRPDESLRIQLSTTALESGHVDLHATIFNSRGEQATFAESTVVNSLPSSIAAGSRGNR